MNRRAFLPLLAAAPGITAPSRAQVGTTVDDLEVFRVKVNARGDWIIARLRTTHRLYGIGDASHSGDDSTTLKLLREYFQRIRGNSPFQIEPFRRLMMDDVLRSGRAGVVAFSALEQALYDLQARALGVPAYTLFGGMIHEQIRHYANINRATVNRTPEGFVEQAVLAVKAGFTAVKMAPFDGMPRDDAAKAAAHTEFGIECIAQVRKAVGPNVFLLVDAHSNFDIDDGLELAAKLEPFHLGWLEEVTRSLEGLAEINSAARMPTAGGEWIYGVKGFLPYITARAVDIVMPDVKNCGGMLELKKIAAMAEGAGLTVAPHGPASPVGNFAAAHVCATLPNFTLLEMAFNEVPWRANLINPPEVYQNGSLDLSDGPGLGVRLNEGIAFKHAV
jgi:galactonate dehydratase